MGPRVHSARRRFGPDPEADPKTRALSRAIARGTAVALTSAMVKAAVTCFSIAVLAGCVGPAPQISSDGGAPDAPTTQVDGPADRGGAPPVLVYAHTSSDLFSLDPATLTLTRVGAFATGDGHTDAITDIAITMHNQIYGCSFTSLYRIDAQTAVLTPVGALDGERFGLNGLSFIPDGMSGEVLIAAGADGTYYRVDPMNAVTTPVGQYSDGWRSSGDLVSVEGAGTFATVLGTTSDVLVRVDPGSGAVVRVGEGTGFEGIWGLGYFRQKLFGFTASGRIIVIDTRTGVGTLPEHPIEAGAPFWGAGVTTVAPVDLI